MEFIRLWQIFLRRKLVFFAILATVVGVTVVGSFIVKPVYKVRAKIWLNLQNLQPSFVSRDLPSSFGKMSYSDSDNLPDTFVNLIESRKVAEKVIDKLGLKDKKGNPFDFNFFVEPGYLKKVLTQGTGVEVEQIDDAELFEIRAYARDEKTAVDIANTFASEFSNFFGELNRDTVVKSRKYVEEMAEKARVAWEAAEKRRVDFKSAKLIVNLETQKNNLLSELSQMRSKLDDIEQQVTENQAIRKAAEVAIKEQPEFKLSSKSFEANPFIKSYKSKLYDLDITLAEKLLDLTPEHPDVKAVYKKIEQTKAAMEKEVEKTFANESSARNTYYDNLIQKLGDTDIVLISLKAQEKVTRKQIVRLDKEMREVVQNEFDYSKISVEADTLKTTVNNLNTQLEAARLAEGLSISNSTIIEEAKVPSEANSKSYIYFPNKKLLAIVALFLGTMLGLAVILFLEYIDVPPGDGRLRESLGGVRETENVR